MTTLATVYVVFADADEAQRIGRATIVAGLAACVNILGPCTSIYRWQGAIEQATEVPALFKTRAERVEALVAAIAAAHSYDVPAITAWPITVTSPGYAAWIMTESAGEISTVS